MWESVALTLAGAAGYSIGTVLQKKGTLILPPLSFELKVIRLYALNRLWISGFLLDICGAALMLTALSQAPVSVVQPIAGCELGILCIFSHFYLQEVMNGLDWIAVTLAGIGAIGVGVGGEEQKVEEIPLFSIPWLVLSIVILFVLLNTWLRIYKKQRREQDLTGPEVIEEVIYGLESGILFGVSSVILKMGFVMSEMGFPKIVVPAAISCSVACSAVGFVYQTRGLKHGRAIVVSTCTSVASLVSGVVVGMVALDEHLPTAPTGRFFLLLGWFFIITGMILLVTSTRLIARLPKPMQKFLKSNMERSHSIMRPGSARGKDPIQSTSIHASSLQHILTCAEREDDMNVEEVEKLKGKQKWGFVLATRASARIKHDGKTIMEKAQDLAKSKNLETGVVSEGGLYPCEVANTRPRRVKRKAGRVSRGAGSSRNNAAAADVAGTWVRELNGRIHQVSIKKLDAEWTGPWIMNDEDDGNHHEDAGPEPESQLPALDQCQWRDACSADGAVVGFGVLVPVGS